jgi:hypothetical protein
MGRIRKEVLGRVWKKAVVAYFETLIPKLARRNQINPQKSQIGDL